MAVAGEQILTRLGFEVDEISLKSSLEKVAAFGSALRRAFAAASAAFVGVARASGEGHEPLGHRGQTPHHMELLEGVQPAGIEGLVLDGELHGYIPSRKEMDPALNVHSTAPASVP